MSRGTSSIRPVHYTLEEVKFSPARLPPSRTLTRRHIHSRLASGNHCSLRRKRGQWPSHCVAYTQGAGLPDEFAGILASGKTKIIIKRQEQDKEQYGAFEDLATDSIEYAWLSNADSVDVCGIAGDYCVKASTENVLKVVAPEKVSILTDCVRSIDGGEALEAFINEKGITKK